MNLANFCRMKRRQRKVFLYCREKSMQRMNEFRTRQIMSRHLKQREIAGLLLVFCAFGTAVAQNETGLSEQLLPILAQIEKPEPFRPIPADSLEAAKGRLLEAMAVLEARLSRNGNAAAGAWKRYLRWSDLKAEIESDKPSRSKLLEIGDLFRKNHPGLEMQVFRNLREAINDYAWTRYFSAGSRAKTLYERRLREIKEVIVELQAGQDDGKIGELGIWVADLENANQCPKLVSLIHSVFSRSNFQLQISESFARRILASQPTTDVRPVRETILGVLQCGSASTTATVSVNFIPSNHLATFQVCIAGKTISNQVGYKDIGLLGSIQICSQGNTDLIAQSNVYFDGNHISHSGVSASANTQTQIKGVSTPPLIRGIVLNQINKQKSQGEAIGANLAKQKFGTNVSQKLITAVGKANQAISERYNTPTARLDFRPRGTAVSTTDDTLRIFSLVGSDSQLGVLNSAAMEYGQDVALQIHESVINNALEHLLAGKTLTNDGLRKMAEQFGAELPPVDPDEKEIEIKFKRSRPVTVSFSEDSVVIKIALVSLKQDDANFEDFVISAEYDLDVSESAINGNRVGDVKLKFEEELGTFETAKLGVVDQKLAEIFKEKLETIDLTKLELSPEIRAIGMPRVSNFKMNKGWLSIGINIGGASFTLSDQHTFPMSNSARIIGTPVHRTVGHTSSN